MRALVGLTFALAVLASPAPSMAALPAPTLTLDTAFAPPTGVSRHDFNTGLASDVPNAVAVAGDRIYAAGETIQSGSNPDLAILARRADGSLDTGFAEDGKFTLAISPNTGRDLASGMVVLPDGRLRVAGATDVDPSSSGKNMDVIVLGLNPDGSTDTSFGGGDGLALFAVGTKDDLPTRMARDPATGRLAIAGAVNDGSNDDTFVAVLDEQGAPTSFGTAGIQKLNRSGGAMNDRGVDVVFRPGGGVVVLTQVETNPAANVNDYNAVMLAFNDLGQPETGFSEDGELNLEVGQPDIIPGGLTTYNGMLWASGSTKTGVDIDAFIARVAPDGSGMQFRRFDPRGRLASPDQAVNSQGLDLAVAPGTPDTLVVAGAMTSDTGTDWAAAAFNDLGMDLAALGYGEIAIPTPSQGALVGVAPGDGWVAVLGSLVDQQADTGFGMSRLLIDAEKRCDLAIDVPRPLQVDLVPGRSAPVRVEVRNVGTKACAGTVSVRPPFALRAGARVAPLQLAPVLPGETTAIEAELSYSGPRVRESEATFEVRGVGDDAAENDVRRVGVSFQFCALDLRHITGGDLLPSEGSARVALTVRNTGTSECQGIRARVVSAGRRVDSGRAFSLRPGRGADDTLRVALARGTSSTTRRVTLGIVASATGTPGAADDALTMTARVVRVGDSDIRRVAGRVISGSARPGRGEGLRRTQRRVRRVQVAVSRVAGKRCRWLTSRGSLRRGSCSRPVWLRARGTRSWRFGLRRSLPSGRYVAYSRATIGAGFPEASFSRADRNRRSLRR